MLVAISQPLRIKCAIPSPQIGSRKYMKGQGAMVKSNLSFTFQTAVTYMDKQDVQLQ